jgi:hypothetical protein
MKWCVKHGNRDQPGIYCNVAMGTRLACGERLHIRNDVTLSDPEVHSLVERTLVSTRPTMAKRLGSSSRAYDAADEIATAIDHGIREGLRMLNLIPKD